MTIKRYTETSVQSVESSRCVATRRAAGSRRACMTLHTTRSTARRRDWRATRVPPPPRRQPPDRAGRPQPPHPADACSRTRANTTTPTRSLSSIPLYRKLVIISNPAYIIQTQQT
ncbi:hypothetical protein K1T71_008103 [Dendrolimus kikuchii]|uniref:Uncharacterized protein n=1 Tax=Dendrolimus kikuchii TaxID=765133 RepID=A0ACC1CWQ6_9NEOP|nr:hypothetical protein K1T71_008103 [Dendrolimus kikuchii]